jgi:hypothetical protein
MLYSVEIDRQFCLTLTLAIIVFELSGVCDKRILLILRAEVSQGKGG